MPARHTPRSLPELLLKQQNQQAPRQNRRSTLRRPQWNTTPDSVVAWGWYVDGERVDTDDLDLASQRASEGEGFVWLGLKDPTDADMAQFARRFDLHPLAIEDAVEGHTRSKLEVFDDTVFTVVSTVNYIDHDITDEAPEIVETGQIMVFMGPNFVMTVRRGESTPLQTLRRRLENQPQRLSEGPYFVLYSVLDVIVDDYGRVVTEFETDVEELEVEVFSARDDKEIDRLYAVKRELIEFRRAVVPLTAPLAQLANRSFPNIPEDARAYFREVADHHTEAREAIQSFDDMLSNMMDATIARVSLEDNRDMRRMSAALAVLVPPTTIGSVYGMNFDRMPELHTQYGYFVALGVMFTAMLSIYLWFRHKKWL